MILPAPEEWSGSKTIPEADEPKLSFTIWDLNSQREWWSKNKSFSIQNEMGASASEGKEAVLTWFEAGIEAIENAYLVKIRVGICNDMKKYSVETKEEAVALIQEALQAIAEPRAVA